MGKTGTTAIFQNRQAGGDRSIDGALISQTQTISCFAELTAAHWTLICFAERGSTRHWKRRESPSRNARAGVMPFGTSWPALFTRLGGV